MIKKESLDSKIEDVHVMLGTVACTGGLMETLALLSNFDCTLKIASSILYSSLILVIGAIDYYSMKLKRDYLKEYISK